MTVCTIITSCLYKESKHFSILTDVIYKKELSLCINLLFLVLSFGFLVFFLFFFSLNTSMVGAVCFGLNCCYICLPFFLMVLEVEELVPQHGAGPRCCLHSSKAPPGVAAIHIQMGKGRLFFQVSWLGGSFVATAVPCQVPGFERPVWLIPSQRKTCQLFCKEMWGCIKGMCFGSPGAEEKNPCSCGNERICSMSYLGTGRCIAWLGASLCSCYPGGMVAVLVCCSQILQHFSVCLLQHRLCLRFSPSRRCPEHPNISSILAPEEPGMGSTGTGSHI